MSDARRFFLVHDQARRGALQCVADAPDGFQVIVKAPARNLDQNSLLWVLLQHFSDQLQWPVNGVMQKITPAEWKDLLSAAWKRESQRVAMGLDGGMVMLGLRTSRMGKREFAEFVEFILATAAERGVTINDGEIAHARGEAVEA